MDATGRGSRDWLRELGVAPPSEEWVEVHINYLSWFIRRKPHQLNGHDITVINRHASTRRAGAAAAIEDERRIVTLRGYLNRPLPSDYASTLDCARSLVVPSL